MSISRSNLYRWKVLAQGIRRIDSNRDYCRHSGDCGGVVTSGYALNGNLRWAVLALVHDVLLTMFFELQVNLIWRSSPFVVVGYSLNDTVVVFDRVRENLRKYKSKPLDVLDCPLTKRQPGNDDALSPALIALIALWFWVVM